jgi:hypothetical protein
MTKYLATDYIASFKNRDRVFRRVLVTEEELPTVPAHIHDIPLEASRPTRMRATNERGEPIAEAEPVPVRWDGRLGAYVKA